MRNITFHEVGMENFGPYIEPMVLPFTNNHLTLITGPNGIGKTMSLEALPFTLFGETCKKVKGDDVVNNRTGKNCHTWTKFTINDDTYQIDRYHKYTKIGTTVTICKNGEEPYKKGHREVVPEVEKLICSKKSFTNTLMFGQKVKDFFTDLIDSDKKEIFRKILDLDIYTKWYKQADLDLKAIKESIQEALKKIGVDQGVLSVVENQIDVVNQQIKRFEDDKKEKIATEKKALEDSQRLLDGWQKDLDKLVDTGADIEKLNKQIQDVEKQKSHHINEKETTVLQLMNSRDAKVSEMQTAADKAKQNIISEQRSKYDTFLSGHQKEIEKIDDEISTIKQEKSNIASELSSIETEKRIIQTNIDKLNNSLELDEGSCPTCLREIDDACRKHLEDESMKLVNAYYALEKKEKTLQDQNTKTFEALKEAETKKTQQHNSFQTITSDLKTEENIKIAEIDDKLNSTFDTIKELADKQAEKIEADYVEYIDNLSKKLAELYEMKDVVTDTNEKRVEIENMINSLQQNIAGHEMKLKIAEEEEYDKSQLTEYQVKKQELETAIAISNTTLTELKNEEQLALFWKTAWSPTGIPSMLIDEAIPFMNEKVTEYLDLLSNGRYIVSFDTLAATKAGEFRDKISVNVLDTYTRANSRMQLSGGQTRLVDIATILTLGDLQSSVQDVKINILLFDEIFDSLDEENIGFVSKILSQLKIDKSIYLISHTQVEQLEADETLEFK